MGLAFNTAGVKIKYAQEASVGVRPTTGFTALPDIKTTPDLNAEPSTLDTTTFESLEWKTAIPGLKDVGGAVAFTGNLTSELKTAWASCVSAAKTARAAGKATWFEVAIPNFDSFFFATEVIFCNLDREPLDLARPNCRTLAVCSFPTKRETADSVEQAA